MTGSPANRPFLPLEAARSGALDDVRRWCQAHDIKLLRTAVVLLGALAVLKLGGEFWRLLMDTGPLGANDLKLRYLEVHRWFAGLPVYATNQAAATRSRSLPEGTPPCVVLDVRSGLRHRSGAPTIGVRNVETRQSFPGASAVPGTRGDGPKESGLVPLNLMRPSVVGPTSCRRDGRSSGAVAWRALAKCTLTYHSSAPYRLQIPCGKGRRL